MFEGLKAFRHANGRVALFRIDDNLKRLASGAPRLSMPVPDIATLKEAMVALVAADKDWVPSQPGTALYLRPTYIATDAFLGVRPATRYLLYVITSPVGAYYASGLKPVKIWVETEAVRAVRGGIGWAKAAANYVASMKAADDVRSRGYEQVLWLDAIERRYLEEVGTMNLFVVIGDEIATPPLAGSILPGITRDTVLTLAREWGLNVTERPIAFDEIVAADRNGTLREIFGSGHRRRRLERRRTRSRHGHADDQQGRSRPRRQAPLRRHHLGAVRCRAGHPQLADVLRLGRLARRCAERQRTCGRTLCCRAWRSD